MKKRRFVGLGLVIAIGLSAFTPKALAFSPETEKDIVKLMNKSRAVQVQIAKGEEPRSKDLREIEDAFGKLDDHFKKDMKTVAASGSDDKGNKYYISIMNDIASYERLLENLIKRVPGMKSKKELKRQADYFKRLLQQEKMEIGVDSAAVEEYHTHLKSVEDNLQLNTLRKLASHLDAAEEVIRNNSALDNSVVWKSYFARVVILANHLFERNEQAYKDYYKLSDYLEVREEILDIVKDRFSHKDSARKLLIKEVKKNLEIADKMVVAAGIIYWSEHAVVHPQKSEIKVIGNHLKRLFEKLPGGTKVAKKPFEEVYKIYGNHLITETAENQFSNVGEVEDYIGEMEEYFGEHEDLRMNYFSAAMTNVLGARYREFQNSNFNLRYFDQFWKNVNNALASEYLSQNLVKGANALLGVVTRDLGFFVSNNPNRASELGELAQRILDLVRELHVRYHVK